MIAKAHSVRGREELAGPVADLPDPRPEMEWDTAYRWPTPGYCTPCARRHRHEEHPVIWVTKERRRQARWTAVDGPGHLVSRCTYHQDRREALLARGRRRW